MAEFKSNHGNLIFYVNGKSYRFSSGKLRTIDVGVIKAAEKLDGVERVDKEKPSKLAEMFEDTKTKEVPKTKVTPKKASKPNK